MNQQNRNTLIDTENRLIDAGGDRVIGLGERGKGLKSAHLRLQNSHRDVKYSIGNIINKTVITGYVWCQVGTRIIRGITL